MPALAVEMALDPQSIRPIASGASLPCAMNRSQRGVSPTATAAITPAAIPALRLGPARRRARRKAIASASRPPARATTSHRSGGSPASILLRGPNSVVKKTGSGFHDGPPVVSRLSRATSLPQTIHAQGS